MRIMILGATGMLGSTMFRAFFDDASLEVFGTARNESAKACYQERMVSNLVCGVDVENLDSIVKALAAVKPNVVVNCIGLVKQLADSKDPLQAVPINTLLPHRLASLCGLMGSRLIHFSTDCVFSGARGYYSESDFPDAGDLYGRSKLMGEVDYPNAITLRTSIIGHELKSSRSLLCWFLAQEGSVRGYRRAVFSGLPTIAIADLVRKHVLPRPDLSGLFHVAANPINKFELLNLVAAAYKKEIHIEPDETLVIDRSLNASKFNDATGYSPPGWPELVTWMHEFK